MGQDASGEGEQAQRARAEEIQIAAEAAIPALQRAWDANLLALQGGASGAGDAVNVSGWHCILTKQPIDRWYSICVLAARWKGSDPMRSDEDAVVSTMMKLLVFRPEHIQASLQNCKGYTLVIGSSVVRNDGRPMSGYEYLLIVPEQVRQQVERFNALKLNPDPPLDAADERR